uniref:Uncharacterized protein n=1 Tax=Neisseria meningitidis alpha275 TaxID=295996 RepID=C6SI52_NEIME|nr:hypothetical protein predicted by Glimmer/Critica [Neisseria meningitidis alpha275]
MKIFWRIFMRQISLTDYFCKGLIQLKSSDGISNLHFFNVYAA